MPVDNQLYDRLSDTWWDDAGFLNILKTAVNPARFGYMREVLIDRLGVEPQGKRALDIGSGGGLLAEEFARLGFAVTGIDPSVQSVDVARGHAADSGLEIEYVVGRGENLPFANESFDVVYCCDVLEHVDDVGKVVAEAARVLAPGGVFLYDTINRTLRSKLIFIKLFQEWRSTSFMEPNLHDWDMFVKPSELGVHLEREGLEPRDLVGISPAGKPPELVGLMRRRKRGELSYSEFGRRLGLRVSKDTSGLYAGYAAKPAAS